METARGVVEVSVEEEDGVQNKKKGSCVIVLQSRSRRRKRSCRGGSVQLFGIESGLPGLMEK